MKTDNISEVIKSIDDHLEGMIRGVEEAKKDVAAQVFKKVVKRSPVWSGPYVKNHRIGIGKIDRRSGKSASAVGSVFPPKMSEAEAQALKAEISEWETGILKGKKINLETPIYISNSIGHAVQVEYIGWKKTPAHHVYGLTYEEILVKLDNIIKVSLSENAKIKK